MTLKKIYLIALSVVMLGSCTKRLDELLVNPNGPSTDQANPDLYLPVIQSNFAGTFNTASSFGMELTRMIVMYGPTYNAAYSPQSYDGIWQSAYTGVFKHANELIPVAYGNKQYVQVSIAKVTKAYTLMTLVDMFGNIPLAEANLGSENTNPAITSGSDVYKQAIALLDETIGTLDSVRTGKLTHGNYPGFADNFFGSSTITGVERWLTTAKIMKLRALMNTRRVDGAANKATIEALFADPDITRTLGTTSYDFEFKYSAKQSNPNSRHPRYNGNYDGTGSAGDYIGTHILWAMAVERGQFSNTEANNKSDPRTRYYFYRQRTNQANVNSQTSSCSVAAPPAHYPPGMPFCLLGFAGWWGRDHGDNSGIPPDGPLRTTVGVYPFGGKFDNNQGVSVGLNDGGNGAGIQPIWQASFTEFLRAEAILTLGIAGDARAALESGVRKSIAKVLSFPATVNVTIPPPTGSNAPWVPDAARIDAYVNTVLAAYDAAGSTDEKLNVVMREYYIALWGNGVDAHNGYRRSGGMPNNLQLAKLASPGPYIRSMLYPSTYINLNLNAPPQHAVGAKEVFWDTFAGDLK